MSSPTQKTMQILHNTNHLIHPIHFHSFAPISGVANPLKKCSLCEALFWIQIPPLRGNNRHPYSLVQCRACGLTIHRCCAFKREYIETMGFCSVNSNLVRSAAFESIDSESKKQEVRNKENTKPQHWAFQNPKALPSPTEVSNDTSFKRLSRQNSDASKYNQRSSQYRKDEDDRFKRVSRANSDASRYNQSNFNSRKDEPFKKLTRKNSDASKQSQSNKSRAVYDDDSPLNIPLAPALIPSKFRKDDEESLECREEIVSSSSFSSNDPVSDETKYIEDDIGEWLKNVGIAIQAAFHGEKNHIEPTSSSSENEKEATELDTPSRNKERRTSQIEKRRDVSIQQELLSEADEDSIKCSHESTSNIEPIKKDVPREESKKSSTLAIASAAFDVAGATKRVAIKAPRRIGIAAVAGGVAGGVVGLAMAGPAGVVAGASFGQYVSAYSMLAVESAQFVAVAGGAVVNAQKALKQAEKNGDKILAFGEGEKRVALIRPKIRVDPAWDSLTEKFRQSVPSSNIFQSTTKRIDSHRKDSLVLNTDDNELEAKEKVFLIVSRMLKDKQSAPGHVYRCLVEIYKNDLGPSKGERKCRDNVHAIIYHVTNLVLEEKPELRTSEAMKEMSLNAVERIIFSTVYTSLFEEIATENKLKDEDLDKKRRIIASSAKLEAVKVSATSLSILKYVSQSQSSDEKLCYCVEFIDSVFKFLEQEAIASRDDEAKSKATEEVCTDSLLKSVCEHIIRSDSGIELHSEISFLEEFLRDEQLLKGKEGYVLVTLQAALHFLHLSSNIEMDIFLDF